MSQKLLNLQNLQNQVEAKKRLFREQFRGLVVAVSGGPDSIALFHLLWRLSRCGKDFSMAVAHVAYGLRGDESELDFRFVEALAAAHGIPLFSHRAETAPEEGIQLWARRVRRSYFASLHRDGWAVALAHHEDDVAETALLRLARGASPGRLDGMRVWDEPYWRPLLHTRKAELLAFLVAEKLPFRSDRSNDGRDYARNVVRHDVLPVLEALYPGAAERVAATVREARVLDEWLREVAETALARDGAALLGFFRDSPPERARMALGAWLTTRLPVGTQLSRQLLAAAIARLAELAAGEPPTGTISILVLPEGRSLQLVEGRLVVAVGTSPKTSRRTQYARYLAHGDHPTILLTPGSNALLRRDGRCLRIALRPEAPGPARVTVGAPRGRTHKALFQRWNVRDGTREEYVTIEYNGDLIGLFDGKRPLEHPFLSLQFFTREPLHG